MLSFSLLSVLASSTQSPTNHLSDPLVLASAIASVPATLAAVLSFLTNRKSKETIKVANNNTEKLDKLGNGLLDEKIRRAVREVLEESGQQATEAFITDVLGKILDKHLEE